MRLTIVGCSPAWPNPDSPHSGYLVESAGRLLLDCGPGVLGRFREREGSWPEVDAIVITHWHLDHWGDLVPWVWGSMFGLGQGVEPPELWIPPGGISELAAFGKRFGTPTMFEETFRLREYAEREAFETAGGFEVIPMRVPHYSIDTYALRVTDGARTLAYSGDSAPSERLAEVARDTDLFLCEATLADGLLEGDSRGHLSADEAVETFRASGAKRLLLTHRPHELPAPDGVQVAYDGLVLDV